jgi:hypothetical protein
MMNELEMIKSMLAEEPPSPQVIAAGRRRLQGEQGRRAPRRPRLGWPALTGVGLAATATAAAVAVIVSGSGSTPRAPGSLGSSGSSASSGSSGSKAATIQLAAAVVLNKAATAADARPVPEPQPGQWLSIHTTEYQVDERGTMTDDNWITFDGRRTAYFAKGHLVVHDSHLPMSSGSPKGAYDMLKALPTDPQAMRVALPKAASGQLPDMGNPQRTQTWSNIVQLLWNSPFGAPSKVEAAIFRGLAQTPGMRVENVKDVLGRPAIGLYQEQGQDRADLLLDPHTYQVIGRLVVSNGVWTKEEQQMAQQGKDIHYHPKGTVTWSITRTVTLVKAPGETPDGAQGGTPGGAQGEK